MTVEAERLLFWCAALPIMAIAFGRALRGIARVRAGRIDEHRADMRRAVWWVGAFLVAYLVKLVAIGHEDLATWSVARLVALRIHECVVFTMLAAGGVARVLGPRVAAGAAALAPFHRWAGRAAAMTGMLGLLTAAFVLVQMFAARFQE